MFCTNCGNQVKDGETFCNNCGTRVDGTAAKNTTPIRVLTANIQDAAQKV